ISEAFSAHRDIKEVMVFLRGHGVPAAFATRIYKKYGRGTINVVRANPYRLAHEIWGIGFRTADGIAQKLGLARDAPERLEAGLLHALENASEEGHVHVPDDELLRATSEILAVDTTPLEPRLGALEQRELVVREVLGMKGPCTGLPWAYEAEAGAAARLAELIKRPGGAAFVNMDIAIEQLQQVMGVTLAAQQFAAVRAALTDKCVVITGGPGVGKTTIVRAIVTLATAGKRRVALAAPTGRAAKRLTEATSREAVTIHRLLEYAPQQGGFQKDADNPLDVDMLVVDEASMVDIQLFSALLSALPARAQLVLVGDIDQLPSVGAGAVLDDVIASNAATVIRLTEIFRQAAESKIVVSAHRINAGELPDLDSPAGATSDFYFIGRDDPEAARATIVELVAERIPSASDSTRSTRCRSSRRCTAVTSARLRSTRRSRSG
ncbi:MAG TPA: AAA family ATPase, partial [Kofleriaceae bacterium]|nr:AAA family ATPase [Kofleriaceae bacterium]